MSDIERLKFLLDNPTSTYFTEDGTRTIFFNDYFEVLFRDRRMVVLHTLTHTDNEETKNQCKAELEFLDKMLNIW